MRRARGEPRPEKPKPALMDFSFADIKRNMMDDGYKVDPLDLRTLIRSYHALARAALDLEAAMDLPKDWPGRKDIINDVWADLMKRAKMAMTPPKEPDELRRAEPTAT